MRTIGNVLVLLVTPRHRASPVRPAGQTHDPVANAGGPSACTSVVLLDPRAPRSGPGAHRRASYRMGSPAPEGSSRLRERRGCWSAVPWGFAAVDCRGRRACGRGGAAGAGVARAALWNARAGAIERVLPVATRLLRTLVHDAWLRAWCAPEGTGAECFT